jgi:hypothetical protein
MLVMSNRHPEKQALGDLEAAALRSAEEVAPSLQQLNQLLDKRLEIAREGLSELRHHLLRGRTEDAERVLENLDEDLYMLKRRMAREVRKAGEPTGCH